MENRPDDDLIDKIMVVLANWSKPVAEEWFKLMGWLLIISAFGFAAIQVDEILLYLLLGLSGLILILYFIFGYHNSWYEQVDKLKKYDTTDEKGFYKDQARWARGVIVGLPFVCFILYSAWLFATKLSNVLNN